MGFVLDGIIEGDRAGGSVSDAGDLNGDGIGDLLIGAEEASPQGRYEGGESYVVFGRTEGFPAQIALASLLPENGGDGSTGFVMTGIDAYAFTGTSVSGAGDTNNDGVDDLIVGAPRARPGGRAFAGESYVIFGSRGQFPAELALASLLPANGGDGSAGVVLEGIAEYSYAGYSVSGAGDLNGDGTADLTIGTFRADPGGISYAGQSYVVFGRAAAFPALFPLAGLLPASGGDGSAGFVLNGVAGDNSGISVSDAGDVNGDGTDDLIIGAIYGGSSGRSYVVFGRPAGFAATFELGSLLPANGGDGSTGFVLQGIALNDFSGFSVSAAGDVNGDGVGDLIVGAPRADPGGRSYAGESYVVFGRRDSDGDGLADDRDNCQLVSNADQRDTDGDGFGNICDADFEQNCTVNFSDLAIMKSFFFAPGDFDTDLTGDGQTNFVDLAILKVGFFLPPGPSGVPNICAN